MSRADYAAADPELAAIIAAEPAISALFSAKPTHEERMVELAGRIADGAEVQAALYGPKMQPVRAKAAPRCTCAVYVLRGSCQHAEDEGL